jgi:hypothetical protein
MTTTTVPTKTAGVASEPGLALDITMNGPRKAANGGFAAGTFAVLAGGTAKVTLRRPIPLATRFGVAWTPGWYGVMDGLETIATVERSGPFVLEPPARPTYAQAEEARRSHPFVGVRHALSDCVVCGPERVGGLRVTPGPLAGHPGILAAPYDPPAWFSTDGHATHASVWGALDCVSYPAHLLDDRRLAVLGSMTAHRTREIAVGEPLIAVGWTLGSGTRSHKTSSALLDEDGAVVASALTVWVEVKHQRLARFTRRWG